MKLIWIGILIIVSSAVHAGTPCEHYDSFKSEKFCP